MLKDLFRGKTHCICFILLLLLPYITLSQRTTVVDSTSDRYHVIVIPGKQYGAGGIYRWIWGSHYRDEWTTPVKVPVINLDTVTIIGLDTVETELVPTEQGGGRQSKTLRLETKNGKQYVLRTIDKNYRGALPPIAQETFVEDVANDQVSTAHPFAASEKGLNKGR